jgi:UDP-N-acetylmuramoyl-tripeptide--D-alanyl-D-alanine ligase
MTPKPSTSLTLDDLKAVRPRRIALPDALQGRVFTGVSTDSRTLSPGDLFVALSGANFDGHAFVAQAKARGAAAVIVGRPVAEAAGIAQVVVDDTLATLSRLARNHRRKFHIPVIAVAGSNGKTTTKEMIAAVLRTGREVLSTAGNLNNHIGVPLTLLRLRKEHEAAVVEIGTNHPGELAALLKILEPTHGLLTNIGLEHLEFFGSLRGVAKEEGALFRWLAAHGTAFVNADDPETVKLGKRVRRKVTFGFSRGLDVAGSALQLDARGCPEFRCGGKKVARSFPVRLPVPGAHTAANALAAAAVGVAFKVPPRKIQTALEQFQAPSKRMEVLSIAGVTVFNDTYNANPDSVVAGLKTLAGAIIPGKRIAVLADMKELGAGGPAEHARVGKVLSDLGIEYLLTYGEVAKHYHDSAHVTFGVHYDQKNVLAEYLAELLTPGDAVLIKGSRGMAMEDVVSFLMQRLPSGPGAAASPVH